MPTIESIIFYSRRPKYWIHACEHFCRRFRARNATPIEAQAAFDWAAAHAVSITEALTRIGLLASPDAGIPRLPDPALSEVEARVRLSGVEMGGAGDIHLLYAAACLSDARRIVETGVAYGWSSFAILSAIHGKEDARLVSVDMPYIGRNAEAFVGVAVPDHLRKQWLILSEPDRNGLKKAIALLGGQVDLCHYDSDKSWHGRQFGYKQMWKALRPGGIFISDDLQDNLAFKEFVEEKDRPFAITEFKNKYVGIVVK